MTTIARLRCRGIGLMLKRLRGKPAQEARPYERQIATEKEVVFGSRVKKAGMDSAQRSAVIGDM